METSDDNADEQRQDDMTINDIPSEHPGTETSEVPRISGLLHMVAEPARPLLPSTTRAGADDIDPSSIIRHWDRHLPHHRSFQYNFSNIIGMEFLAHIGLLLPHRLRVPLEDIRRITQMSSWTTSTAHVHDIYLIFVVLCP